jgi:hypothetical protein
MGRGRAKAKQTKLAREMKYFSPGTDLSALERELHGVTSQYDRYAADDGDEADEDEDPEDQPVDGLEDDYGKWAAGQP